MSDNGTNGHDANAEGMSRILSLKDAKPKHALTRAQRAEVERLAYDMVIQECAKVHEYYLTQIPTFVARMVQDALLSYGLIVPQPGTDIAPAVATAEAPESQESRENTAASRDEHDSTAPVTTVSLPVVIDGQVQELVVAPDELPPDEPVINPS